MALPLAALGGLSELLPSHTPSGWDFAFQYISGNPVQF
jgi:hypothetical protein